MKYLYCYLSSDIVSTDKFYPADRCEACNDDCEIDSASVLNSLQRDLKVFRMYDRQELEQSAIEGRVYDPAESVCPSCHHRHVPDGGCVALEKEERNETEHETNA